MLPLEGFQGWNDVILGTEQEASAEAVERRQSLDGGDGEVRRVRGKGSKEPGSQGGIEVGRGKVRLLGSTALLRAEASGSEQERKKVSSALDVQCGGHTAPRGRQTDRRMSQPRI